MILNIKKIREKVRSIPLSISHSILQIFRNHPRSIISRINAPGRESAPRLRSMTLSARTKFAIRLSRAFCIPSVLSPGGKAPFHDKHPQTCKETVARRSRRDYKAAS